MIESSLSRAEVQTVSGTTAPTMGHPVDSEVFLEVERMLGRLHRLHLGNIEQDLERAGVGHLAPMQGLLIIMIGDQETTATELMKRASHLGTNLSYNIDRLAEGGYLRRVRCQRDRRVMRLSLTDEGMAIWNHLREAEAARSALAARACTGVDAGAALRALHSIERLWVGVARMGLGNCDVAFG